ncbi:MAG: HlyD family efflux transporter periplasmic adaptor subunit, partial [Oscillospiraceae bacterium]|nr:HlyD family efflux transporter periplasmic adaptor subunit [Oscillospiraceae bacterium]
SINFGNSSNSGKRKLRKALYVYITVMAVIIFFSRTIYNISLPKITIAMPQSGSLTKELEAYGIISHMDTFDIYAPSSGQLDEIFIGKGDVITPDTIVAAYRGETDGAGAGVGAITNAGIIEAELGVERINNQLEALALNKATIGEKLHALGTGMDGLHGYQSAVDDAKMELDKRLGDLVAAREIAQAAFDDYEYREAIADAEREWDRKQAEADSMRFLYEQGAAALIEAASAQSAAEDAERAYNRAVDAWARANEQGALESRQRVADAQSAASGAMAALERAEKNLELAGAALAAQNDEARRSLELEMGRADLDIERAKIDLRAAEASLAASLEAAQKNDNDDAIIRAGCRGVVISVEKNRGQFIAQGEKVATVGANNNSFSSVVTVVAADGQFIEIGDEANIVKSGSGAAIKAVVYDIAPAGAGDALCIGVACETDVFEGGEYVCVKFRKQTPIYDAVVPNEAIVREGMMNYVWTVGSRQGALGIEYFTVKVRVILADSDEFYTAIARGLDNVYPVLPVVVGSDRELTANGRVRRME